jgi:hypothetical protein
MSELDNRIARLQEVLTQRGMNLTPVVVLGMHRSGTTMLAKLLEAAGVFMGDRLSGNYEPRLVQDANRQIFDYFDASWLSPDRLPAPMELRKGFGGLTAEIARRLIEDFVPNFCNGLDGRCVSWGFKDPRTSMTAGLFLRLFPHAKAVFIHRNGEDVAASILKRELRIRSKFPAGSDVVFEPPSVSLARAVRAWEIYNDRALSVLPHFQEHATLRYEDVVASPERQLQRAFAQVGVDISSAAIQSACISAERVGGAAEFVEDLASVREYLARSQVREALDKG